MIGRHCCAVLLLALSAAGAGLPAPRILPGQTLHLDTTQVSLSCISFCMKHLQDIFKPTSAWVLQLDVPNQFLVWAVQQQKNYTAEVSLGDTTVWTNNIQHQCKPRALCRSMQRGRQFLQVTWN